MYVQSTSICLAFSNEIHYNITAFNHNIFYMQFDHHPFLQDHPELQENIHELKKTNVHFAKLLREYEGLDIEIGRAESDIPGYMMSDADLTELKKEKIKLKDELIAMLG